MPGRHSTPQQMKRNAVETPGDMPAYAPLRPIEQNSRTNAEERQEQFFENGVSAFYNFFSSIFVVNLLIAAGVERAKHVLRQRLPPRVRCPPRRSRRGGQGERTCPNSFRIRGRCFLCFLRDASPFWREATRICMKYVST